MSEKIKSVAIVLLCVCVVILAWGRYFEHDTLNGSFEYIQAITQTASEANDLAEQRRQDLELLSRKVERPEAGVVSTSVPTPKSDRFSVGRAIVHPESIARKTEWQLQDELRECQREVTSLKERLSCSRLEVAFLKGDMRQVSEELSKEIYTDMLLSLNEECLAFLTKIDTMRRIQFWIAARLPLETECELLEQRMRLLMEVKNVLTRCDQLRLLKNEWACSPEVEALVLDELWYRAGSLDESLLHIKRLTGELQPFTLAENAWRLFVL